MIGTTARTRRNSILVGILALALIIRIAAAVALPDQGALLPDAAAYRDSAASLASRWQMSNPMQMPLYPLMIALSGGGMGQIATDIALSVVGVLLVYLLSLELFHDGFAAMLSGLVAACYLPLVFFTVVGLSETLFIALVLGAFLLWYRGAFAAAAVLAVLATLTRPVFDLAAPILVLLFAFVVHRLTVAQTVLRLLAYAVIYGAMMAPWWLHNYQRYGSFVRLNPNFGTVLYAGNNPRNQTGGGNLGEDYDLSGFAHIADPLARDRALRDAAVRFILDHPQRFLELAAKRFVRIWRFWPSHEGYRSRLVILASLLTYVPVLMLALVGMVMSAGAWRRLLPILLFGLGYTAIHMVLVGTIRYRLPLEPFLIIFAGIAASRLMQRTPMARRWIQGVGSA